MARLVIVCPFCQKRLETADDNLGRQGQCPGCQNVFIIRLSELGAPVARGAADRFGGPAQEFEYQEMSALSGVGAVAACLLLLVIGSLLPWVAPYSVGGDFMPSEKLAFVAVSAACCVFLAVSFLARKSLVPGVLISAGWGMMALIWTGGILVTFSNAVKGAQDTELADEVAKSIDTSPGIYLALIAALLTVIAATFFYYQSRDSDTFRRMGAFLVAIQALAVVAGLLVVFTHVKPAINARLPKRATPEAPTAQLLQPTVAPQPPSAA